MTEVSVLSPDVVALREASKLLRHLSLPAVPGETVKAAQRRVHRHLRSWSFNRVRDLWRPDPRARVRAHELEELRRMASRKRAAEQSAIADLRELEARIARLEQILANTDPEMHGPSLAAARHQRGLALRALGARDRS